MKKFFIKKFVVSVFFLLLFMPLEVCAEYISSDNTFSFNLWFTTDADVKTEDTVSFIDDGDPATSESLLVTTFGQTSPGSNHYFIRVCGSYGWVIYYFYIPEGNHMLTVSFNGDAVSTQVSVYIDGVGKLPFDSFQRLNSYVSGDVSLGDAVIDGTFVYSSDILSQSQINSLYDFGSPGSSKYYVNLLFWTVIKQFRSFF